jgi:hypothetical protein
VYLAIEMKAVADDVNEQSNDTQFNQPVTKLVRFFHKRSNKLRCGGLAQ